MTSSTNDVLTSTDGAVGRIRLNRPKAIHALNTAMCKAMADALLAWRDDDAIHLVIIDHAEGRGFCAGGDIRMIAESGKTDGKEAAEFFYAEYQLNHLLFTFPKPVVALMDGITMGGGVGISQPAKYRVATENTRLAMPETGIGLFPDVGGGWYLSRLPGHVGEFLALTGARLDGAECRALGLASHYVPANDLEALKDQLIATPAEVEAILAASATATPEPRITANRDAIDRHFAGDTVEAIMASLANDASDWASKEHKTLTTKSPQSCKVSLRIVREGRDRRTFEEEMAQEYAIASRIVCTHDFIEGVRALIVDKDNKPVWKPAAFDEVSDDQIDALFAPLTTEVQWKPLI